MAEEVKPDPGAPIAKDAIDPELVKLGRTKVRIGMITCAVIAILCVVFVVRLTPDRRFGAAGDKPDVITPADVVGGKVTLDQFVALDAEAMMSHAIRAVTTIGRDGLRVAPIRGTAEHLWLVTSGDASQPAAPRYVGRLRRLADLPFATAVRAYAAANPRPLFATPAAVRAGFASGQVTTVGGETVTIAATDAVAFDVVDPGAALIVAAFTDKLPDAAAWTRELATLGLPATPAGEPDHDGLRFTVASPNAVAAATQALETAKIWAAQVDPVTHHYQTTWAALAKSPAGVYTVAGGPAIPEAQLDLVGLYVARGIPDDAYALIDGERPDEYWYVLPITVALGLVGLLFAWGLVRAVRRDLLPPRA